MNNEYKIELGVELKTDDINGQIKEAQKNIKPIEIKVDTEAKELTNSIKEALNSLSKGTKNALTLDTTNIEGSLKEVSSLIKDVKTTLGSLDSGSGMKSLLSSVNQIATALGRVTDESETLVKSLTTLSKKDFSFNIGLDFGKKNLSTVGYGRAARKQVLPQLESQIEYLENLFGGQQAVTNKLVRQGKAVGFDVFTDFNDFNSSSAIKKMEAMEKYINSMKKLAAIDNINLDGFNNQFSKSASELINNITGIENAVDKAGDVPEKIKNLFGSGIDAEALSTQLDSVVTDLNEIKTTIQGLSSSASIDGLVQSFNRLSDTLEKLSTNFTTVKDGLSNIASNTGAVNAAQQMGQKIGDTVEKSVKQYMNIDEVIDEQVTNLMNKYSIVGKKGSRAFNEIRQAIVELRRESASLDDLPFDMGDMSDDIIDIRQLTSALSSNMNIPDESLKKYQELWQYIQTHYNQPGSKVVLPESIKQEYGKEYSRMRSQLGSAFTTTGKGTSFEDFIKEINRELGLTIDLSEKIENVFAQLLAMANAGKGKGVLSEDGLFSLNHLNADEIKNDAISAIDNINVVEQNLAQTSTQTANVVAQSGEKIEQSYNEVENAQNRVSRNSSILNVESGFKRANVQIESTEKQIENLETALGSLGFGGSSIRTIVDDIKQVGFEVEKITSQLNDDGSVKITVTGIDDAKNAVQVIKSVREIQQANMLGEIELVTDIKTTAKITQQFNTSADAVKKLNAEMDGFVKLQNQINQKKIKIAELEAVGDKTNQVNELKRQLEELENTYNGLMQTFMKKLTSNADIMPTDDVAKFNNEVITATQNTENKLKELDAKIADTNAKMANGIRLDFNKYDLQVQSLENNFGQLSNKTDELRNGIALVKQELSTMKSASTDEELIESATRYKQLLKETEIQLKQNKLAEESANKVDILEQSKEKLSLKMNNWLKENSAAAGQFGAEIRDLQVELKKCNNSADVKKISSAFDIVKLKAKEAGVATQTFGDKLKTQFTKYSSYFSIASVFMYVSQAMRDMFEQVKAIDSAMTELKKVTDETDASYNNFLDNAATKAKEIGTTIDGLVASTADFARLGYGFEDAQGLAEVANIYAVVGDEVEGVEGATESLISTMAAFKNEATGLSNADFAMGIVDKYNEIGNKFAITSGGIGEALERSASSLNAANNSMDESIALITAANTVVQNPDKVGNAFKTISMRIRGAKTE